MDDLAARICKRLKTLESNREPHENTWQECYYYSHPIRAAGLQNTVIDAESAKAQTARLLDTTSTDAARVLASSIVGGMTPANSRWFEPDIGESNQVSDESKRWLDDASQKLWENIHASNFDAVGFECMQDLVDAGWFCMYVGVGKRGGFSFQQWHISECFVAASEPGEPVDTVYRKYMLTAEQAVNQFREEYANLSDKLKEAYKENPDTKFEFVHAIEPRKVHAPNARMARNMPIASYHIEVAEKKVVRESGYHTMPVIVARWSLIPCSDYAVGPMFDALPACKELNQIKRMELANLDLAISGMWIAEDDGVLNAKTIKVGPRKVIVANSVDSMKELKSGADFNVTFTKEDMLRGEIRKILMADQLQPQDGPAMTATEVHVRVALIRQQLGPVYGRLQAEYLQSLISRCFDIAYRAGILGQAPDELAGREFAIKYISPLSRAQLLEQATSVERTYQGAGLIAQLTGDPSIFDNLNPDEALDVLVAAYGAPLKIKRTEDEAAEIRDARTQAQEQAHAQQQQEQMMQQVAPEIMKQAAAA